MAHLIILRNPLTPHDKEEHTLAHGAPVIDWLQEHYPDGFGMPIRFFVNADEKPLDDLDYVPADDDVVILALMPGGFLAAMPLLVKVIIGLAVMAAAFFAMQLFAAKPAKPKQIEKIDQYNVSAEQNAAKIGEAIPVVYGEVWMVPDYISQPVTWFSWANLKFDELFSGIQYLDVIMCVGRGHVEVTAVKAGMTDAKTVGPEFVAWQVFPPNRHQNKMGVIQAAMGGDFYENVITNTEVSNQEFIKAGDESTFYTICKNGNKGSKFQVDVLYPNGLYWVDDGNTKGKPSVFEVYWQEVDANSNLVGPISMQTVTVDSRIAALGSSKNIAEVASPFRRTITIDAGKSARWAVKLKRISDQKGTKDGQTSFSWTGLKLIGDYQTRAYGDVTLLAVRVKASRGIGGDAAVRISAKCKRWANGLPNGEWQASSSPADAFYDIYTNQDYGAARPVEELDMVQLRAMKTLWGNYQFNHVFRNRTTIWEALKTSVIGMAAEPLPLGSVMSIAQDGVKPARAMLFTDANIVEGTMKIEYMFDIDDAGDGIEVKYTSPVDWLEEYTRYPTTAALPDTVELLGCTSAAHAAQYARLVWQRTRGQRKRITFNTEMEGIILVLGDRIAVSHEMPKWGASGLVLVVQGTSIVVDQDLDWSGPAKFMMFRKADGTPSEVFSVTKGAKDNIAILGKPLNFIAHTDDDYDYTAFTFGTTALMVRDFTVASTKHNSENTVTIEAVNYAPEIFDGAMTFLGGKP